MKARPGARVTLRLGTALALGLLGCRNIERFDAQKPAAYCGALVGGAGFQTGFIATGAPPNLELRLQLDTASLTTRPGTLTSNDGNSGFCKPAKLFDEAPLRAMPELLNDTLSQADLGQGHEHDLFAWVDSACQGTQLAVISLLTNGAVEVRLLKPGPDVSPEADPRDRSGFALFYLERNERGCSY